MWSRVSQVAPAGCLSLSLSRSWPAVLPAVRALGGPEVATRAAYDAGEESWAASLQQATAELAAAGVYLDQAGGITAERPETPWNWEDGAPALASRQRQ